MRTTSEPHARQRSATRRTGSFSTATHWRAGSSETFAELVATMENLCYRIDYASTDGDSPAALGNRIAAAAIAYGRDGRLERAAALRDPDYRP